MQNELLVFNGINASDGSYRLPPRTAAKFGAETRRDRLKVKRARNDLDSSDLAEMGWGVVFGRDVDCEVKEALGGLLKRREEQAGELYRDDLYYEGGDWLDFLQDNGGDLDQIDPRGVPYYLLLVGDADQFSLEFQCGLGVAYAVGRLSFETPQEYAHYAKGVLESEDRTDRDRRVDVFGVRNWDDNNTAWSERFLIEPLAASIEGYRGFEVRRALRQEATKERLAQMLGDAPPSLLFANCHGVNFWPDDPLQPSDQGALLCYDWPGPRIWGRRRLPADLYFAARDVPTTADLRGLMAFFFACYGLGTPRLDSYDRASGKEIGELAEHDFLAELPRRLLGIPKGALAVVGHVDQAWCHSYHWDGLGSQIGHFESAMKLLMKGRPIGQALEGLADRLGTIDLILTTEQERRRKEGEEPFSRDELQTRLWTAHYDALCHVLLGDPAVRLPAAVHDEA